jgi:heme/copper-type cytochrome/quinol oxidase subunit 4
MANNVHETNKRTTYKKRFFNTILSIPLVALALFLLSSLEFETSYFLLITFISIIIIVFQLVYFHKKWKIG